MVLPSPFGRRTFVTDSFNAGASAPSPVTLPNDDAARMDGRGDGAERDGHVDGEGYGRWDPDTVDTPQARGDDMADAHDGARIPKVEPPGPEEAERLAREAPTSAKAQRLFKRGKELANDPRKVRMLVEDAVRKARRNEGSLAKAWDELQLLIAFVRDSVRGRYRPDLPNLGIAIGALLYFLSPFDLIPDFIVGLGYLDDAAVLGFATHRLSAELQAYRTWRDTIDVSSPMLDDSDGSDPRVTPT